MTTPYLSSVGVHGDARPDDDVTPSPEQHVAEQNARAWRAIRAAAPVDLDALAATRHTWATPIELPALMTYSEARARVGLPPLRDARGGVTSGPRLALAELGATLLTDIGPAPTTIEGLLLVAEKRALAGFPPSYPRDLRLLAHVMAAPPDPLASLLTPGSSSPEAPRPKPAGSDVPSTSTPHAPRKLAAWFHGGGLDADGPVTLARTEPRRAPLSHAKPRRKMPTPGEELAHAIATERARVERKALTLAAQGREDEARLLLAPRPLPYRPKSSAEFFAEIRERIAKREAIDRARLAHQP